MALDLKQLEAFVWVADLGSFSKAAARLTTTQPNISIRIRALENNLKVALFERDAGSVRLTTRGQDLLVHARQVLSATDSLIAAVGDSSIRQDTLRLGVTEMIVHTWLHDLLKAIREKYPVMQVELTIDLSDSLTKSLFERNIDLALQNGPFDRTTSASVDLGSYPLTWVAAPELELPTSKKITSKVLAAHPILTHARDTALFKQVAGHFNSAAMNHVRLVPSSNLAACLFMAINGMGVATLPRSMVMDSLATSDVVELKYHWTPECLDFHARYDETKSPKSVAEIAKLANVISSEYRAGTS